MTAFFMLSSTVRSLFALWALLLCFGYIGCAALSALRRRYGFAILSIVLFAPVYLFWQVIFDLSLLGPDKVTPFSSQLCGFGWIIWLGVFIALSLLVVILLMNNFRLDSAYITPDAIKQFLDKVPCGICCWRESGKLLFSNMCMNNLCLKATGGPLLNGNNFSEAVKEGILNIDGKVWRFSCRKLEYGGDILNELIASDITSEYSKTKALEKEKTELDKLNHELGEYYLSIDDTVRRQEILQAKVSIHDEMNRLMLSTTAVDRGDFAELDRIFSLWERNALLLCKEANITTDSNATENLIGLARALKVRLEWDKAVPEELNSQRKAFFFTAANEALVNAVKHADASEVIISFSCMNDQITCLIENDGRIPSEFSFRGGLANLKVLASECGAEVKAETGEKFVLSLSFPVEEKNQPKG